MASMNNNFEEDLSREDMEKLGEEGTRMGENGENNMNESNNESSDGHSNHGENSKRKEPTRSSGGDDEAESSRQKKKRIIWTNEMHQKFLEAIGQTNPNKVFPRKIVEAMNVPGLTRQHVASHLQRYRKRLKKGTEQMTRSVQQHNSAAAAAAAGGSSRNSLALSSTSRHSSWINGNSPSYSRRCDLPSLRINSSDNAHNQHNRTTTEVNTNFQPHAGNDNMMRNLFLSISNSWKPITPPAAADQIRTTSASTAATAMGPRMESDRNSLLFSGGADKSEITSYSTLRSDFQFGASSLPPHIGSSSNGNPFQISSLPAAEDHHVQGTSSSLPPLPECLVIHPSELEMINAPIDFNIPQQEMMYFGGDATTELDLTSFLATGGHNINTNLEQQNSVQWLPSWEYTNFETLTNSLPPLPSSSWDQNSIDNGVNIQEARWNMGTISNHQNTLPPLPSEDEWNPASAFVPPTNYNDANLLEEQNIVPPLLHEGAAAAHQLSSQLPAGNTVNQPTQPFVSTEANNGFGVNAAVTQNLEAPGTEDTSTDDLFDFSWLFNDDTHF